MQFYLRVAALFVVLATVRAQSESVSRPIGYGMPLTAAQCGCKTIQTKLDQQEKRFSEMFNQQKKEIESTLNSQFSKMDQLEQRVSKMIIKYENNTASVMNAIVTKLDQLGKLEDRVSQMLERQQNDSVILEELKQVIESAESKNLAQQHLTQQYAFSASGDSNGSLPIVNNVDGNVRKCQECLYVDTPFGPNWIVIFQRIDDSGNFGRPWKDYRDGFGTVGQHFWLGLEKMHQLTKDSPYELVVEMTEYYYGEKGYARYDQFQIGSEAHKYPLKLGTHSGLAGDGLADHKSMTFSTYDSGKDIGISKRFGNAGWWFYGSWSSYLTGTQNDSSRWPGMWWYNFKTLGHTRLSSASMMIRAI